MRSSRSGYVNTARVTSAKPVMTYVRKCMAFMLVVVMMVGLGLSAIGSMNNNDIRDFVNELGIGESSKLGSSLMSLGVRTAYADDTDCDAKKAGDCDSKGIAQFDKFKGSSMKDAGFEGTSELQQDGKDDVNSNWAGAMDLADKNDNFDRDGDGGIKKSTKLSDVFSMVLKRLMPGYYLKNIQPTEDDVYAWKDWECGDLDSDPTLENANCDVPNVTTEGVQNLVALVDDHGIQNYKLRKAQTPFGLGFSKDLLPTDDVPVNLADAQYKYTAMEALGYNLAWTNYNGEWDHIQVLTNMRLKSSMGLGGGLKTVGQTVNDAVSGFIQGTSEGFKSAVSDVGEDIQNGDWVKAPFDVIAIPFKAIWNGFKTAVASGLYRLLNNIMNGFEYTSVQNKAWYRSTFVSETVYGLTTLTEVEKNAVINKRVEDAAVEGVRKAMNEMPEELSEDAIRAKYTVPYSPWIKYNPEKEQPWDDWKRENAIKLMSAKELGVDMHKYEVGEFQSQTPNQRYKAFSNDWKAGVDNKVQQAKEDYAAQVKALVNLKVNTQIKDEVYKDYGSRPASAWMFCTEGEPADAGVKSAMDAGRIRKVGKEAYKYTWDNLGRMTGVTYQCATPVRPTIVGGLLGSSRKNTTGKIDTRRTSYDLGKRLIAAYKKGTALRMLDADAFGSSMLFISQRIVMLMNTLLGWSFEPILEKIGVKQIVMDWTKKLRDTIYIQFIVMAIAIAGLMVVWRLIRGNPVESFKQIAAIIMTVALGIILLFNTDMMFKLVDDVPTSLERAVMGTVLSAGGNDKICKATGSPKGTVSASATFASLFGDKHEFNPDAQIRVMQCKVWTAFVFAPWSYGQFGVGWNELWANGYSTEGGAGAKDLDTSDSTNKLVGDAGVHLGGGNTIHNWALYQVAHTTTGTVTTQDMNRPAGNLDKAMYRLVDVQAGPENGSGRDGSHLAAWSSNTTNRALIGMMAIFTSITGLLGIGGMAIKKIEFTITATLMLLISPIIMLFGILPGKNQLRMKQYGWELVSLCLKRIAMVLVMCVGIEAIVEIGMATTSSWFTTLFAIAIVALVVKFYGTELADKMTAKVDAKSGQWKSANDVVRNAVENNAFLTNMTDTAKSAMTAVAGGVIGGMMAGNLTGSLRSVRNDFTKDFLKSFGAGSANMQAINDLHGWAAKVAASGGSAALINAIKSGAKLNDAQLLELRKIDAAKGTSLFDEYKDNKGKFQQAWKLEQARLMLQRERQGLNFETGAQLSLAERRANREAMWAKLREMGVADAVGYAAQVSGTSVMKQEIKLINDRLMRNRLAQGRTSVVWEHMKKQHAKKKQDPFMADKKDILQLMNQTGFDSDGVIAKINHSMFGGVTQGAVTDVEGAPYQLNKGDEATMLTRDNLKMLIMSAKDPRKLKHDIEVAMAEGGAAWDKVSADLMDGNVIDKRSKAYQMAWGIDPTNETIRNYDTAGVKAKFAAGDAEITAAVQKARKRYAREHKIDVIAVTDDQAIGRLVSDRMQSGEAAFEMVNDNMRNNEKTRALEEEKSGAMDVIMAGQFKDKNGNVISREEAQTLTPDQQRQQEADRRAMQNRVSDQYKSYSEEQLKVDNLDLDIKKMEKALANGDLPAGMNRSEAQAKLNDLRVEKQVHERTASNFRDNAHAAEREYQEKYNAVSNAEKNWQSIAQDNINATIDAMSKDPSFNNSSAANAGNFLMRDANDRLMKDAAGNNITFNDYTKAVARASAINEEISVNNSTASLYNLQAQSAGSWSSLNADEQKDRIKRAEMLAQSQDPSMECTGFDQSTGKFQFKKRADKAAGKAFDGSARGADRGGMSSDGTRTDIQENLRQYIDDKTYGNTDPTTNLKREKLDKRRAEVQKTVAETGMDSLDAAWMNNLDGHGGSVYMSAADRSARMETTMDAAMLDGAARGDVVSAARKMTEGLFRFAGKHHTDNYDNRTVGHTQATYSEMGGHTWRPR